MKVIGLLSWFDERPDDLRRAIRSHAEFGFVSCFVCVDGRYKLYGDGVSVSAPDQYAAIEDEAKALGLDLVLVRREHPWEGELHKRATLFRLGLAMADVGEDWFWIIDGDNELAEHEGLDTFRARLASTPLHVAEVILSEPGRLYQDVRRPMRQLFRALPGFSPYGSHWHYCAQVEGEWRYLWGPKERRLLPALEMHEVVVRHHHMDREQDRRNAAYSYYAKRDERQVETSPPWFIDGPDGFLQRVDNEAELS